MTLTHTCPTCLGKSPATPKQLATIRDRSSVVAAIALWQWIALVMIIGALSVAESWPVLATLVVAALVITPTALFCLANALVAITARKLHKAANDG